MKKPGPAKKGRLVQERITAYFHDVDNYRGIIQSNSTSPARKIFCLWCIKEYDLAGVCACVCSECKMQRHKCECTGFFIRKPLRRMFFENRRMFQTFVRKKIHEHMREKLRLFLGKRKLQKSSMCAICWKPKPSQEECEKCKFLFISDIAAPQATPPASLPLEPAPQAASTEPPDAA